MELNTQSLDTGGGYDELSFPIVIDNGRLSNTIAPESNIYALENEELFESGKYDLTPKGQDYYESMFQEYLIYSKKTLATNIPITFSGGVDQNSFDNPTDFISKNSGILTSVKFEGKKIPAFWQSFQDKVDVDPDFEVTFPNNQDQQNAQRLLLKLRTLQSFQKLYDNLDMRKQVESGKFLLEVGDIRTDKKFVKAGVGSFTYTKPL